MQEGLNEVKRKNRRKYFDIFEPLTNVAKIKNQRLYKYNEQKYNIGSTLEDQDIVQSPHVKVRDTILGLSDFTKTNIDTAIYE